MQESSTLIIKHLPAELNLNDREEFLKLFGAKKVKCLSDSGKMKYTAFAVFDSNDEAKLALSRLHQLEILNRKLVVEFAKKEQDKFLGISGHDTLKINQKEEESSKIPQKEKLKIDEENFCKNLHGISPLLNLDYVQSSLLKYKYPPPTPTILANISHALASVPKFYTQTLHLMNKMNLPAPFGPLTPAPPFTSQESLEVNQPSEIQHEGSELGMNKIKEIDSSSEESELESDTENTNNQGVILPPKRQIEKVQKKSKKFKFHQPILPGQPQSGPRTEPSHVFEIQSQLDSQKKIQFNFNPTSICQTTDSVPINVNEEQSGFGVIASKKTEDKNENQEPNDENLQISEFISLSELKEKRMSRTKMKTLSIFQNYDPGEPTVRLYIKNLAKQVEEKDLRYIFGRFIDLNSEVDKNMFDIRLMKEGRMKGQAFVTLANERQAIEAVKETNGFVLHTKPLVVQFARSAKPKDVAKNV